MTRKATVMSIFGEIEEIVAKQMMAEGHGIGKLAPSAAVSLDDLPPSTRYNDLGQPVRLVIVVPALLVAEFERRVADLRA